MNSGDDSTSAANPASGDAGADTRDHELTGLPWFDTWRAVYVFVLGSFVFWVGLLFVLSVVFS
jgi:hypothetical protein